MKIPIVIQEYANIDREGEVISVGLPIPQGKIREKANFAVVDGKENVFPTQWKILSRWEDDSIKRILVHFLADVPAKAKQVFFLTENIDSVHPGKTVKVTKQAGLVTVDTGKINFKLDEKGHFPIPQPNNFHLGPWAAGDSHALGLGVLFTGLERLYYIRPDEDLKNLIINVLEGVVNTLSTPEGLFTMTDNA